MNHSSPGRKLTPELKQACDSIYRRDPARYRGLVKWVWFEQRCKWPDEAIATCLRLADPYIDQVDDYWPYLARLMPKAKAQATGAESERHKNEVGNIAAEFVEFMRQRNAAR